MGASFHGTAWRWIFWTRNPYPRPITRKKSAQKYLARRCAGLLLACRRRLSSGWTPSPLDAARQLAAFFGEVPPRHLLARDALCGSFLAVRTDGGRKKYVLLEVSPIGNSAVQVEETEHSTSAVSHSRNPAELRRFLKVASTAMEKRDGWMIEAPRGQVIIFIRDRLNGEANVYTVIADDREPGATSLAQNVHLLRPVPVAGGARIVPLTPQAHAQPDSPVSGFLDQMIWHFSRQEEA